MRLHDWLFQVVADACYDRDYLYLVFIRLFTALMNQILDRGRFENSGKYSLPGMKSNLSAQLAWQLEHHLSWMGPNWLQLRCTLTDTLSGVESETRSGCFDLSTGEMLASQPASSAFPSPLEAL